MNWTLFYLRLQTKIILPVTLIFTLIEEFQVCTMLCPKCSVDFVKNYQSLKFQMKKFVILLLDCQKKTY